jgi:hypothetical protein
MKTTSLSRKGILATCVAGILASVFTVSALTVSPARLELSADPGKTVEGEFTLINEQGTTETFYTSTQNFDAQGESGTPSFSEATQGLATWVKVVDKITLAPGERIKVPFSIVLTSDADAGGHFAAIFLSTTQPKAGDAGQVSIGAKVGMLILLRVNGEIKENGGVQSFSVKDKTNFVTSLPVTFVYKFQNTGNDRVMPKGNISIRNTAYFETASLDANPQAGNVLPNSTRRFEVTWGSSAPIDPAAPFFDHVKYQANNFALGLYFVNMDLAFGTKGTSSSSLTLFVFPWHLMVVVLVILVIVLALLRIAIKRYNAWIIKQARKHVK